MNAKDWLVLSGVGVALYFVWQFKKQADAAADVVSTPIARIISSLTLPGKVHIAGGVVFPDGGYVSWDAITDAGSKLDHNMLFVWAGRRYKVLRRRADGNYDAVPA